MEDVDVGRLLHEIASEPAPPASSAVSTIRLAVRRRVVVVAVAIVAALVAAVLVGVGVAGGLLGAGGAGADPVAGSVAAATPRAQAPGAAGGTGPARSEAAVPKVPGRSGESADLSACPLAGTVAGAVRKAVPPVGPWYEPRYVPALGCTSRRLGVLVPLAIGSVGVQVTVTVNEVGGDSRDHACRSRSADVCEQTDWGPIGIWQVETSDRATPVDEVRLGRPRGVIVTVHADTTAAAGGWKPFRPADLRAIAISVADVL